MRGIKLSDENETYLPGTFKTSQLFDRAITKERLGLSKVFKALEEAHMTTSSNASGGSGKRRTSKNDDKRGTSSARRSKEGNAGESQGFDENKTAFGSADQLSDNDMITNHDKPVEGDRDDV